jgi:hypothetical protein
VVGKGWRHGERVGCELTVDSGKKKKKKKKKKKPWQEKR